MKTKTLKKSEVKAFCENHKITEKQFFGKENFGGYLDLRSLTSKDKNWALKNVKKLKSGYNKKKGYCYFDNILTKVLRVSKKKNYTIYTTPFNFVAQKGKFTAHGETVKKAIQDLEFKIISEKLKKEPIKKDTMITMQYYRLITGACESGCRDWINMNEIKKEKIKTIDLLPILEKTNAYGLERFKQLITF
jgi:hypothetical protein